MRLSRRPLDLSQTVKATIESFRTRGMVDRHQLTFNGCRCGSTRTKPALNRSHESGRQRAEVYAARWAITVTVSSERQHAVLAVKDTGIGIPADVVPTIFDLFVQSERSLDRSQAALASASPLSDASSSFTAGPFR